jgi:hypothetical protein
METGKHRPVLGPVVVEATCRFESCLQRVAIFQHIVTSQYSRSARVAPPCVMYSVVRRPQQCVEIWRKPELSYSIAILTYGDVMNGQRVLLLKT